MAGHSKWANIKHKKGGQDAKRAKMFTRIVREIQISAKTGGGDPSSNPRLRDAIAEAKSNNMPKDNIDRAIKRGTGELEGVNYEELTYEGYAAGGVSLVIEALTDNRNRTVTEIRVILSKNGGNLGESGSVAWNFDRKGIIEVSKKNIDEDSLMEMTLDHGMENIELIEESFMVQTAFESLNNVVEVLHKNSIPILSSRFEYIPKTTTSVDAETEEKVIKVLELLDDHDDVKAVYANLA